jgi:nicotinate-nucleotide adenylyltransferase
MARIGLLGGTFDPIHAGHLEAAVAALDCGGLDRVLLVPAGRPPHKRATHASAEDRLQMCRLAIRGRPSLDVWDWEARRPVPSYTVDTLRAFREARPADEPVSHRASMSWSALPARISSDLWPGMTRLRRRASLRSTMRWREGIGHRRHLHPIGHGRSS